MALTRINNQALTNVTSAGLPTLNSDKLPSGTVLQVKQAVQEGRLTLTSSSYTTVSGLSVSITPKSTSSKILVTVNIEGSGNDRYNAFRLYRGSTAIGIGDAGSGSEERMSFSFDSNQSAGDDNYVNHNAGITYLDSPSTTSSTTYSLKFRRTHGSGTFYLNRPVYIDTGYAYTRYSISSITVMEIAG